MRGKGATMAVSSKIESDADSNQFPDVAEVIGEFVRQQQSVTDGQQVASNIASLLQRTAGTSMREVDNLISELEKLRDRLRADAARVQQELVEYATLSQSTMQSTRVISESLRNRFSLR
jgi:hypothetical protein